MIRLSCHDTLASYLVHHEWWLKLTGKTRVNAFAFQLCNLATNFILVAEH